MRLRLVALLVCYAAMAAVGLAGVITIGELGDAYNSFPFGNPSLCLLPEAHMCPGSHYQQAYSAAGFPNAMSITEVSFVNAYYGDSPTVRVATYVMSLSTISAGIDTLSNTDFDSNLGPDNTWFATRFLSGGMSTITFAGGPFFYDPAAGNLLVDIRINDPGLLATTGDYPARNGSAVGIFSRYQDFSEHGSVGYGLVTQFTADEVPEPGTFSLCLLAVPLLFLAARSGRRFRSRKHSSA
jgi:hypothetical protein